MRYLYQDQTLSFEELKLCFRNVSFPADPSESDLAPLGVTLIPDPVPTPDELLAQAKADKLAEINAVCQSTLEALTPTYPERELTTFDKQESEARAYLADPTASTPLLSALAAARGIELADFVGRVIAKADAFTIASGFIIGQRQALEDRLDAAQTVDDVQAVIVSISMPGAV
uniref:hypothetical protein n=1 Tax=Bilophila wadsworthia TaxID=35833 RepID=UPI003FF0D104